MIIDKKEAYRYMGYGRTLPDETIRKMADDCEEEILKAARPSHIYRRFELTISEEGFVEAGNVRIYSRDLMKNLAGCEEVIFFAATIGLDVDRLLTRYIKLNISKGAVFQAVAAAAIEAYCNECQRDIEKELAKEKLFVRPRFSPGYGDVPLSIQKQFLEAIDAVKYTGIHLMEGDIMVPEKSVTAVMGISKIRTGCVIEGCEACSKKNCLFRR